MRNKLLSLLSGLVFLLLCLFIFNCFLWNSALTHSKKQALTAVRSINSAINEAKSASKLIKKYSQTPCTSSSQLLLNKVAATMTYVRSIALVQKNEIWCSSVSGGMRVGMSIKELKNNRLYFIYHDTMADNSPAIIYSSKSENGFILVSIALSHFAKIIASASKNIQLLLFVDNHIIYPESAKKPIYSQQIKSKEYNFSLVYNKPCFWDLQRVIFHSYEVLTLLLAMSLSLSYLLNRYLEGRVRIENELKNAISRGDIIPYYQPIIESKTGRISGCEILARWQHKHSGFISPNIFIPIAEKNGLLVKLTHQLMNQALQDLLSISPILPEKLHVGINIGPEHEGSMVFENDCIQFLKSFPSGNIILLLEITERAPLLLTENSKEMFARLHKHGVKFALDDFGTGYSALSYMHDLDVDFIKIDGSFIKKINKRNDENIITDCLIELAKKISKNIVAEGVEHDYQVSYLKKHDVNYMQGYYYSHPLPFEKFKLSFTLGLYHMNILPGESTPNNINNTDKAP